MSQPLIETDRKLNNYRRSSSTPRWVKVFLVITIIVALLVGIMVLTDGHGPSRHSPSENDSTGHKSPLQHEMPLP